MKFFTQYPFNKWGWDNFIWWFKHRLLKEHRYHVLCTDLKPGYHCFDTVVCEAIFERFKEEYPPTRDFIEIEKDALKELDGVLEFVNVDRPRLKKLIEEWNNEIHKDYMNDRKNKIPLFDIKNRETKNMDKSFLVDKLEKKLRDRETEALMKLMKHRHDVSW